MADLTVKDFTKNLAGQPIDIIEQAMIKFAKYHLKQALKSINKDIQIEVFHTGTVNSVYYSLENIK